MQFSFIVASNINTALFNSILLFIQALIYFLIEMK